MRSAAVWSAAGPMHVAVGAHVMHEGCCEHSSEQPPRWLQVRASDRDTAVVVASDARNSADAARTPAASQQATEAAATADVATVDAAAAELDACALTEGREASAAAGEEQRASPLAATAAVPGTSPSTGHSAEAAGVAGTATACSTAQAPAGQSAGCSGDGSASCLDSDASSRGNSSHHGGRGRGRQSGGSRAVVRRNGGRWTRAPLPRGLWKYWLQRYTLFSRFDEGVLIDEEGWFSVTPEALARWLPAEKVHTTPG